MLKLGKLPDAANLPCSNLIVNVLPKNIASPESQNLRSSSTWPKVALDTLDAASVCLAQLTGERRGRLEVSLCSLNAAGARVGDIEGYRRNCKSLLLGADPCRSELD